MTARMTRGGVQQLATIAQQREAEEIRALKATATIKQCIAWVMVWILLWFALAIAAAGIKTAQYIWWYWQPHFLP